MSFYIFCTQLPNPNQIFKKLYFLIFLVLNLCVFDFFGFYAPVRLFSLKKRKKDLHVLNILHALEQGQDHTHFLRRERGDLNPWPLV